MIKQQNSNLDVFYENDGERENIWELDRNSTRYIREILRYKKIIKYLRLQKAENILDIGCGDGYLSVLLAEAGYSVDAMDISSVRLEKFKEKAKNLKINQINDSITTHSFNKKYDVIVLSEVIEHVENYYQVLEIAYSILSSFGAIIVTVPYKEKIDNFMCPYCMQKFNLVGHLHSFDIPLMENISKKIGFNKIIFNTFDNKYSKYAYAILPLKRSFMYTITDYFFTYLYNSANSKLLVMMTKS